MNTAYSTICKASLALLLGTAMAAPVAHAQHPQQFARATVPFAFQYGERTFPAGKYTFGMISDNIMAVRGPSNAALGIVSWSDARPSEAAKLIFHRYGDQLTLQDVWVPQLSAHLHCHPPKQANRRELAAAKPADAGVEVALLLGDQ